VSEPQPSVDPLEAVELREPRRLGEQLAALLGAEIVAGRIPAGGQFPSAEEIGRRFQVSRTVARETVQTLAVLGLVRLQHGKRTEVLPEEEWNILSSVVQEALRRANKADSFLGDLYEFRLLIEPRAAARMAERGTDESVQELRGLVDKLEQLAETGQTAAVLEADREFHNLVARASGNRVVAAVSRDIREMLGTLWGLSRLGGDEQREVARQHQLIADAIAARDPERAARAMHDHLNWASESDLGRLQTAAASRA
jgi:GntR family transcriptional regulator, transcriptional repressor for pyruvate dehydrogenase complex